jgi:AcrR family transcriptional regulator
MDEKEQEFLLKVVQLFSRFGIKSMTMDDIARNLGMSKKTIYQFVSDKNELVFKAMKSIIDMEMAVARRLCDENENAIDMLFALSKDIARKYSQMHPSINYDMQKYHPDAWHIFQEFQTKFVTQCIQENIERGIKQRLYRDNLDPYLIANFYSSKLHMCSDGLIFPPDKYSFQTIHLEMMRYHIRGIASEKGLAYLKEKVKQENQNL